MGASCQEHTIMVGSCQERTRIGTSCQERTIMVSSCQEHTRIVTSCQEPIRTIKTIRKIKILPGLLGGLQDLGTQQFADVCQPLLCFFFFFIQAQALKQYYYFFTFFTCFFNMSFLLQGYWFILLQSALRSFYSLFRRVLIYIKILKYYIVMACTNAFKLKLVDCYLIKILS